MDKALSKAHMLISKLQKKYGFKYKSQNYLSTELSNIEKVCNRVVLFLIISFTTESLNSLIISLMPIITILFFSFKSKDIPMNELMFF